MSVSIITLLSEYAFSTELQIFKYKTTASVSAIRIINENQIEMLSGNYTPDDNGIVTLYDLQSLFEHHISKTIALFTFIIEGTTSISIHVIKSNINVSESASNFIHKFFLSTLMSEKVTTIGRREILSFIPTSNCDIISICTYIKNGNISSFSKVIHYAVIKANAVFSIDVSPERFVEETKGVLLYYVISAGERKQLFRVDNYPPSSYIGFIFRNCFNCFETFYCVGTQECEPEFTRSSAFINGYLKNYEIKETIGLKASTGPLCINLVSLARDLARSESIFLLDNNGIAHDEVIISDSSMKSNNDDYSLTTFSFTYRRSSRVSAFLQTIRPPKLFDDKFDYTYE